ncbi:Cleft lip and palate transmembrane protein 1-like protein [Halotydeus destructor]|nr:Cleft lip and palate transmembrane protein 1-like protein [Halotydeus destructor]
MARCIWSVYELFNPPGCIKGQPCIHPAWKDTDSFEIVLCTSQSSQPYVSSLTEIWRDNKDLSESSVINTSVSLPRKTLKNGTLYLHAFFIKQTGASRMRHEINPELMRNDNAVVVSGSLTKYVPKQAEAFNLLGSEEAKPKTKPVLNGKPVTHWKPSIVLDFGEPVSLSAQGFPNELVKYLNLGRRQQYLPMLIFSEIRTFVKDLWPVNSSMTTLPLEVKLEKSNVGKIRFIAVVEESAKTMLQLGFSESDLDDVKNIFFNTSANILLLTLFVSTFHMLFDVLAFKNDIQFWRHRTSMAGLSFSTLVWRCVSQFIVTLYLYDQQTSLLVLIPSAVSSVIELWKLKKAMKISVSGLELSSSSRSPEEMETDAYDSQFMKYLSRYVLYPACVLGAIYSLLYTSHKSWFSWCIQSAANGVYAFGFLFMLPQLFINYKLKSVAHLPWRTFMYKAFNTFIDDVFAFILTSIPTAHRVAAFRDDIVFIIYLYQRWLYPVDKKRVNEFGETADDSDKKTN